MKLITTYNGLSLYVFIPCHRKYSQSYHIDSNMFATYYVKPWSHDWLIVARAYPSFCSMKRLGVFLLPLDRMLVHRRSLPRNFLSFINSLPVPLYTPGWREALWELCLAQEHSTMSSARARTRTALGDECTNHEATVPPLATYYVEFLL